MNIVFQSLTYHLGLKYIFFVYINKDLLSAVLNFLYLFLIFIFKNIYKKIILLDFQNSPLK